MHWRYQYEHNQKLRSNVLVPFYSKLPPYLVMSEKMNDNGNSTIIVKYFNIYMNCFVT